MYKTIITIIFCLVVISCGGGGTTDVQGPNDNSGSTPATLTGLSECSAQAGQGVVCGTIYYPDGQTPMANATITEVAVQTMTVKNLRADTTSCTSDGNGNFACNGITTEGNHTFQVSGAGFTWQFVSSITTGDINNIPAASTTPAINNGTYKYAVVMGVYDEIEDLLASVLDCGTLDVDGKLELGTECSQIELIGAGTGTNPNTALTDILLGSDLDGFYPTTEEFFTSANLAEALSLFHAVFLSCGLNPDYAQDESVKTALRNYVDSGGNLYVSDRGYDYMEAIWPDAVEWYGDDTVPQDAYEGGENSSQPVNINDALLLTWLQNLEIIGSSDTTFNTNFDQPEWVVATDVGNNVNELLTASSLAFGPYDVPIEGRDTIPISVNFSSNNGCIFYTSYHNVPSEERAASMDQIRVLKYLLFNRFCVTDIEPPS